MEAKTEQELQNTMTSLSVDKRNLKMQLRELSMVLEKKNEYITELEDKLGLID
jgi:chaperonin cofactor prefoldin